MRVRQCVLVAKLPFAGEIAQLRLPPMIVFSSHGNAEAAVVLTSRAICFAKIAEPADRADRRCKKLDLSNLVTDSWET
jgi:hypothetical protein